MTLVITLKLRRGGETVSLGATPREAARTALDKRLVRVNEGFRTSLTGDVSGLSADDLIRWVNALTTEEETPEPPTSTVYSTGAPAWESVKPRRLPRDKWRDARLIRAYDAYRDGDVWRGNDLFRPYVRSSPLSLIDAQRNATGGHYLPEKWKVYGLIPRVSVWRDTVFEPRKGFDSLTEQYAFAMPVINGDGPYWRVILLHRAT